MIEDCPNVITDENVTHKYFQTDWLDAGEHQYYCKDCGGVIFSSHHHYTRRSVVIHGVAHPNVMICDTCGFIPTIDFATGRLYDPCVYKYQFVNGHYCKDTCIYCDYTGSGHKCTQQDYQAHVYTQKINTSGCWMECIHCHDVYGSGGHFWTTVERNDQWTWYPERTTYCEDCGFVKSFKLYMPYDESNSDSARGWIEQIDPKKQREQYDDERGSVAKDMECKHSDYARINVYIGSGQHEERCGHCNTVLSTSTCSMKCETYEEYQANHNVGNIETDRYFGTGHFRYCTVCGGSEVVAHDWSNTDASNADAKGCVRTCKDCHWINYVARGNMVDENDHTDPHTYFFEYINTMHTGANGRPLESNDNYPCSFENHGSHHTAKCDICGYTHSIACDTEGAAPAPGYPGQHWQFCSKCGGGLRLVDCTHAFRATAEAYGGYHEVYCKICDTVIAERSGCDLILDKSTDEFHHCHKCRLCGESQTEGHVRITVKENIVPATSTQDGSYDLVTKCQICNREITKTNIKVPKTDNPLALGTSIVMYAGEVRNNLPSLNSGQVYLNGTIIMEGITDFLANNSRALLEAQGITDFTIPDSIYYSDEDGTVKNVFKSSCDFSSIMLLAKVLMRVTDSTQLKDELTEEERAQYIAANRKAELDWFTSMTATLTFSYDAFYLFRSGQTEYRSNTYLLHDVPLDLVGHSITLTLPTLTGMPSNKTMYVKQTTDEGNTYTTFLGEYASTNDIGSVRFTTTQGFSGEFLFLSTQQVLEYIERIEPTHWSTGQEAFYYSRNQNKYYHDILCTDEFDILDDVVIPMLPYTVSFDKNADDATGETDGINGEYGNTYILPECGFALEGYTFYAWYDGYCTYAPGANYVLYGDTVFYAKWQNNESPATTLIVRFNKNADDAEGAMPDQSFVYGDQVVLKKNEFVRAGYYFNGWHFREIENESREVWLKDESTGLAQYATPHFWGTFASGRVIELYAEWNTAIIITYDKNGDDAQGEMVPQSCSTTEGGSTGYYVTYGNLANKKVYTRYMYEFVGWNTNKNSTAAQYIDEGSLYGINQNTILYAIWKKVIFEITFDKNADDATGGMDVQLFNEGINDVINQNVFVREGYRFTGWSTNANATSYGYRDGANTQFYRDTTLYAVWVKIWTITFDVNHDDVVGEVASIIADDNAYTKIPANELTLERFVFDGWYGNPECTGTKYYVNSSYKFTADTTLYAKWAQKIFFVSFDANGGEGAMADQIVDFLNDTANKTLNASEFTKARYVIDNWNTTPDGTGTKYYDKQAIYSSTLKSDVTLYVQWKPNFAVVTFDANGGQGSMEEQWIDKNVETALSLNTFTRDGYAFTGWMTSATATYATHTDGRVIKLSSTNPVTYYAQWTKIITITFNANGGYGMMSPQEVVMKKLDTLSLNTFKHERMTFNYWSLEPDGERAYGNGSSLYLQESDDITLYAIWKEKTSVNHIITFADTTAVYDGEGHVNETAVVAFEGQTIYVQGTDPVAYYEYYRGTVISNDNKLDDGVYPTDAGVYTVRFYYEDSKYIGRKDALLTINKAERTLSLTTQVLTLYGDEAPIALRLNSDFDNSALVSAVVVSSDNELVAKKGNEELFNQNGLLLKLTVDYVGEGYTNITFTLPESANYTAASASVVIIAKSGYNVVLNDTPGGVLKTSHVKAPKGTEVGIDVKVKQGWSLDAITVVNDRTWQEIEVVSGKFIMPEGTVSVSAEITQNEYTIDFEEVNNVYLYNNSGLDIAHYGDTVTICGSVNEPQRAVQTLKYSYEEESSDPPFVKNIIVCINPDTDGNFTFNMPAQDITVTPIVGEVRNVIVHNEGMEHGSVSVSTSEAVAGMPVYITAEPDVEYVLTSLLCITGGDIEHGRAMPLDISLDDMGRRKYGIVMPDDHVEVYATFISRDTLDTAANNVNGSGEREQGQTKTDLGIVVDEETANVLLRALQAVNVDLGIENGSITLNEEDKKAALEALAQAGYVTISADGRVTANEQEAKLRVVENTFIEVSVKEYDNSGDNLSITLHITPMRQTVATTSNDSVSSDNSVPIGSVQVVDITEITTVTVGIPVAMALAAGGAGSTIYVGHIHNGKSYEYPAMISGNEFDGFTATFDNPNGYSEFTLSLESSSVVSIYYDNAEHYYSSFREGVSDALLYNINAITMHKMPTGDDYATITKKITLTFTGAPGADVDFDALYTTWLMLDDGIGKISTEVELSSHIFVYQKYYFVDFETNGGNYISSQQIAEGEKATKPVVDPIKNGHTFDGWYTDDKYEEEFDFNAPVTEETTIYAKYTKNTFTVTFDTDNGSDIDDQIVEFGDKAVRPETPEKTGHTFDDWYEEDRETKFDFDIEIENDTTIYAKWTKNRYNVAFDTDGGNEIVAQTIEYCDYAQRPADPEKVGHNFVGWYKTAELETVFNFETPIVQNTVVYAKWEKIRYSVTFEVSGGTPVAEQTVEYGERAEQPDDPAKQGHTFKGWFTDEELTKTFDFNVVIGENITLYAKYERNLYTVTFADYDGTVISRDVYLYGAEVTAPADPVNANKCRFKGWDKEIVPSKDEDTTYTATYYEHDRVHHDAKAAACTETGWEAYDTCSRCDYTTYEEIAALGHTFGEWTVTQAPQAGVKGEETRTCPKCGATEKRDIAALPYVPTTKEDGTKVYNETVTEKAKDLTELFTQAKAEEGTVEIRTSDVVIVFDNSAVSAIGGAEVSISARVITEDSKVENAELVLEVTLTGATFESGSATVSVPFEREIPEGKVPKVYYIDDEGNRTDMNAVYADGIITFTTNHFSTYAVVFEDEASIVNGLSAGAIAGIVVGAVVLLIAIAAGIVLLKKKKV